MKRNYYKVFPRGRDEFDEVDMDMMPRVSERLGWQFHGGSQKMIVISIKEKDDSSHHINGSYIMSKHTATVHRMPSGLDDVGEWMDEVQVIPSDFILFERIFFLVEDDGNLRQIGTIFDMLRHINEHDLNIRMADGKPLSTDRT